MPITPNAWETHRLSPGYTDKIWETFHENSKVGRYEHHPHDAEVVARMMGMWESLPFTGYPVVELPKTLTPLAVSLEQAIIGRTTARRLAPQTLSLENVATILHHANGVTRDNRNTNFPRAFRTVASAGALYPLELFFYSHRLDGLAAGLYHYNPSTNSLSLIRDGDESHQLSKMVIQSELVVNASMVLFMTALFERSIFKYGDRGYRFVLLEAGHVAQNINLVAAGLGLGSVNIGGFYDREVDAWLGLDGLTHSTVYMIALGKPQEGEG